MQTLARFACFMAALGLCIFVASPETATAKTIFLNNSSGGDSAGCGGPSVQACRTLQFAADSAAPGDTLLMVNPGDYGPATIDKSLIIEGGIAGAGVFLAGGKPCITVTAGAGEEVVIRDFTCDQTANKNGIEATFGATLNLDEVVVKGNDFGSGVFFNGAAAKASLFVRNSTVTDFDTAINIRGGTSNASALLQNVTLERDEFGVVADENTTGTVTVTLTDSVISLSRIVGIDSLGKGATVYVSNSLITLNKAGLHSTASGKLISLGGNSLASNEIDGDFDSTQPAK